MIDKTSKVLTTLKLQSLFDAGMTPHIRDRKDLAESLEAAGEKISFYAIEAWFKHTDSNYATEKKSLHPEKKSYTVPKRRWTSILNLFDLNWDDINRNDDDFRDWCFNQPKRCQETEAVATAQLSEVKYQRPTIAVLPVQNLSTITDNDDLADGLTEEVIAQLSRLPEIIVISKSVIIEHVKNHNNLEQLQTNFGVQSVIECSIRQSAGRLRIVCQLIDTKSGINIWSESFRRFESDIFDLLDDIALHICAHIEPKIRLINIQSSNNIEAWQFWQDGWQKLYIDAPLPAPSDSLALFKKAIDLDKNYALAHAGITVALTTGMLWGGFPPTEFQRAKDHAEIAYKNLPESAAVLFGMGMITFLETSPLTVPLSFINRAVEIEPSNVLYQSSLGYLEAMTGNATKGKTRCESAIALSPKDAKEPFICYMLSNSLIANGDFKEAIAVMSRSRMFSSVDWVWIMTAFAQFQLNNKAAAIVSLKEAIKIGARPFAFYRWSIINRLWPQYSDEDKMDFLYLLPEAGII